MFDGSWGSDDGFTAVLKELDWSKACVRKMRFELDSAAQELADLGHSVVRLEAFEAASRSMNQATERHRHAVAAFNLACRVTSPKALATDAVRYTIVRLHLKTLHQFRGAVD